MKPVLAVVMAWVLVLTGGLEAQAGVAGQGAQTGEQAKPTVQEAALAIPAGKMVEVRLRSKEKVTGRLGTVTNESVEVKVKAGGKTDTRKLDLAQIKSIKQKSHSAALYAPVAILGLAGAIALVLLIYFWVAQGH